MSTRTVVAAARCRCGHDADAHEHFRAGRDCSTCGPDVCPRFASRHGAAVLRLRSQPLVAPGLAWNRLRGRC
jgi:hypothetical protein